MLKIIEKKALAETDNTITEVNEITGKIISKNKKVKAN